jgi:hypothetical protein
MDSIDDIEPLPKPDPLAKVREYFRARGMYNPTPPRRRWTAGSSFHDHRLCGCVPCQQQSATCECATCQHRAAVRASS